MALLTTSRHPAGRCGAPVASEQESERTHPSAHACQRPWLCLAPPEMVSNPACCPRPRPPSPTPLSSRRRAQLGNVSALDIGLFPLLYLVAACVLLYVRLAIQFLIDLPRNPLAAGIAPALPLLEQVSTVLRSTFASSEEAAVVRIDTTATLLMCLVLLNCSALRGRR
eukprot:COSAG04_NODE_251_length_18828_cov_18.990923_2_plen_168_part_00